jgi:hypothetical protein
MPKELSEDNIDYEWFCELHNKHKGEEAWLFGKGPSFEKYSTLKPKGVIASINESCCHVKDLDYTFCWYADKKVLKPESGIVIDGSRGFNTREFNEYSPKKKAIFIKHGTGELATSYLIWMGVSRINLVGIDGVGKYSKEFKWGCDKPLEYANKRRLEIKDRMKQMMKMANVDCVDYSNSEEDICSRTKVVYRGGGVYSFFPAPHRPLYNKKGKDE